MEPLESDCIKLLPCVALCCGFTLKEVSKNVYLKFQWWKLFLFVAPIPEVTCYCSVVKGERGNEGDAEVKFLLCVCIFETSLNLTQCLSFCTNMCFSFDTQCLADDFYSVLTCTAHYLRDKGLNYMWPSKSCHNWYFIFDPYRKKRDYIGEGLRNAHINVPHCNYTRPRLLINL